MELLCHIVTLTFLENPKFKVKIHEDSNSIFLSKAVLLCKNPSQWVEKWLLITALIYVSLIANDSEHLLT